MARKYEHSEEYFKKYATQKRKVLADYSDIFWSRVDQNGIDCWEWLGAHNKQALGDFAKGLFLGESVTRVAFRLSNGPIPIDMLVRHLCNNSACVNPLHLIIGTPQENEQDKIRERDLMQRVHARILSAKRAQLQREELQLMRLRLIPQRPPQEPFNDYIIDWLTDFYFPK